MRKKSTQSKNKKPKTLTTNPLEIKQEQESLMRWKRLRHKLMWGDKKE